MTGKEFFKVTSLENIYDLIGTFPPVGEEIIPLDRSLGRILTRDTISEINLPEFTRATMDGYAVGARSTFGASESMPAV
ncbi:MAG: molybdopterin molybdenumtransferase MoeA, partial [Deltaproteobacteria bacterium]